MTEITDHDAYIAQAPEAFRDTLSHLRALMNTALPEAAEVVKYNLPGFQVDGEIVASYAAFSKQCGVYFLNHAISAHTDEIIAAGFKHTKTGITFTTRKPVPDELVLKLARTSAEKPIG